MALRQMTGFVDSLLCLVGLNWDVPDFSTLRRRQKALAVNIPHRGSQGPVHLLIDSTGIKVEGDGDWNARKHGGPKRPVWRTVQLGIDAETLEIRAIEITSSDVGDAPMLPELGQVATQGIDGLRSLPDQKLSDPTDHRRTVGLFVLHGHKAHRRALCCLTNRFCIGSIILLTLHEGLHLSRRNEPHLMAQIADLVAQKRAPTTGFHRHNARL